jgi:hypothetical protein
MAANPAPAQPAHDGRPCCRRLSRNAPSPATHSNGPPSDTTCPPQSNLRPPHRRGLPTFERHASAGTAPDIRIGGTLHATPSCVPCSWPSGTLPWSPAAWIKECRGGVWPLFDATGQPFQEEVTAIPTGDPWLLPRHEQVEHTQLFQTEYARKGPGAPPTTKPASQSRTGHRPHPEPRNLGRIWPKSRRAPAALDHIIGPSRPTLVVDGATASSPEQAIEP